MTGRPTHITEVREVRPPLTRQEYANFYIAEKQRREASWGTLTFAALLDSFRFAGEQYDAWAADQERRAAHLRARG